MGQDKIKIKTNGNTFEVRGGDFWKMKNYFKRTRKGVFDKATRTWLISDTPGGELALPDGWQASCIANSECALSASEGFQISLRPSEWLTLTGANFFKLLDVVKKIEGRKFDLENGGWKIPRAKFHEVLHIFEKEGLKLFRADGVEMFRRPERKNVSLPDLPPIPSHPFNKPFAPEIQAAYAKHKILTPADALRFFPLKYGQLSLSKISNPNSPQWGGQIKEIDLDLARSQVLVLTPDKSSHWAKWPRGRDEPRPGQWVLFSGKKVYLVPKTFFTAQAPVYPAPKRGKGVDIGPLIAENIGAWAEQIGDFISPDDLPRLGLVSHAQALLDIHSPADEAARELARRRLAFNELFALNLISHFHKQARVRGATERDPLVFNLEAVEKFADGLPFTLTEAQKRVTAEILDDLEKPLPANRLIQGDVGSGKTIVALIAMYAVVTAGRQAALMAPTQILAEQHFSNAQKFLRDTGLKMALLTSRTKAHERRRVLASLASGETDMVFGTHSLVSEAVEIPHLALAVVDEQHRFGVEQRASLRKHSGVNVIATTATPIPRTLALTLYGDVDISVIDQKPAGRLPIISRVVIVDDNQPHAYAELDRFTRQQLLSGRQIFVVCPKIGDGESEDPAGVVANTAAYAARFPDFEVRMLHGRMDGSAKSQILDDFANGVFQILVSTTVIEVGIDIPNAGVMIVEHAHKYGRAQIHQLRGRVGRDKHQSYAIMVLHKTGMGKPPSQTALNRCREIADTQDGFRVAKFDLRARGGGSVSGTAQSGWSPLVMATNADIGTIGVTAQRYIFDISRSDPDFTNGTNALLRQLVGELAVAIGGA